MLENDHSLGELPEKPKTPGEQRKHEPDVLQSADLLQGAKEVLIAHGDEVYRLRLTRAGKLILQK